MFRGPRRDLDLPYVVTLGGSETYGKFVPEPFSNLVEARTGLRMVNLGCMNAGLDVYLKDPGIMGVAGGARIAVVQVMGAQNLTNRFYSVHPRRNDRFLHASPLLAAMFHEVDFTEFNFTRHMLQTLQSVSADRFEVLAEDLRAAWVTRMKVLLEKLPCKSVLLWAADTAPPGPGRRADLVLDPLMVDGEMVAALRPFATDYVEVVFSDAARRRRLEGMAFDQMQEPAARGLPGPAGHREIAEALGPVLARLTR